MKNILVLTGSPRRGGNSDTLADAFIKGALDKGHTVNKFETAFKHIQGCTSCNSCWSSQTACVFRDGFTELEALLEEADLIVFATPLYWFSMSAQLKAAIDRFYAYMRDKCRKPLKIKESLLLTCGGDKDMAIFDGIIATYKGIADYMKWNDRGILALPNVYEIGDIEKTDGPNKAEILGRSI